MKSWQTTIAGILSAITITLIPISALLDNDPATIANWAPVIPVWIVAIGLIQARDNNKTSEQVKANNYYKS
jgi:hypothetical protein